MKEEEFFSRLKQQYLDQLPFVVFSHSTSGGETKALLQKDKEVYTVKDYSETGFVFAPFDNEREAILLPENASEKIIFEQDGLSGRGGKSTTLQEEISEGQKQKHIKLVQKAVKALRAGEMDKVVLSRREEVALDGEDPLQLFQDLLRNYPTAFVYCWYHPKIGLWLGATPETLLKVEGSRFQTMSLAGTQNFTGSMNVEWGAKEKKEQQFVTDSILENLNSVSVTSNGVDKSGPYTTKAGNLLHLRTDISGRLKSGENVEEIIHSLHPTPAVCGLPKEKAMDFILKEEGCDREFYTGFLGELNVQQVKNRSKNRRNVENLVYVTVKKQTSLFVNLRCTKIENGKAILFVGGGITKDSVPEDEWQETVNKAQTMKRVLLK